jgi:peptide/nickel transport system substrate-binding protein
MIVALDQKGFIDAAGGNPEYFKTCKAYFSCNTEFSSTAGSDGKIEGDWKKARQLLKEANYDGTPITLMHTTGRALFENLAPVAKAQLERAGFKVTMITAEYMTVMTRAIRKEPPEKGGWGVLIHGWDQVNILDPLSNPSLQANCEKARPGWPCDKKLEELRNQFARESDPVKRKKIADEVQAYAMQVVPYVPLGEWYGVTGLGKGVSGWLSAPVPIFWGVTKN